MHDLGDNQTQNLFMGAVSVVPDIRMYSGRKQDAAYGVQRAFHA